MTSNKETPAPSGSPTRLAVIAIVVEEPSCTAELNAILNYRGTGSMKGAKLYVTLFPCNECAKAIIQSGITEVIYREDKYSDSESTIASRRMFDRTGVRYHRLSPTGKQITLNV